MSEGVKIVITMPDGLQRRDWLPGKTLAEALVGHDTFPNRSIPAEAFSTPTASAEGHWTGPMPDMVRVVHGLPRRLDSPRKRIAALGNSVVPQCAEVVGWVIRHLNEPSG